MSKNLCAAYNYDAMENTLYVSNAFRKKASQYVRSSTIPSETCAMTILASGLRKCRRLKRGTA